MRFDSIFPAAYPGRWPHVHFEVYESLEAATGGGTRIATSQVALPEDACNAVYATSGYEASVRTMTQTSLASDGVFGDDGGTSQLGTVTGSVEDGYTVALAVAVDPTNVSSGASGPGSDGGTGLGLAIARWAVDLHGGRIGVAESARGCRIRVTLPGLESARS